MTDNRAALAEVLRLYAVAPNDDPYTVDACVRYLAERGVLLVTEERLAAAFHATHPPGPVHVADEIQAARLWAALSAEVTE